MKLTGLNSVRSFESSHRVHIVELAHVCGSFVDGGLGVEGRGGGDEELVGWSEEGVKLTFCRLKANFNTPPHFKRPPTSKSCKPRRASSGFS